MSNINIICIRRIYEDRGEANKCKCRVCRPKKKKGGNGDDHPKRD